MEQMRLELTSERMSEHGVVLSQIIFHAMILMRSYEALIMFVENKHRVGKVPR